MKQHTIDLNKVILHGRVKTEYDNNMLHIKTQTQNTHFNQFEMPINSYIQIPQTFKLPLRIDIRVKIDAPSIYIILGKGHVTFGTNFLDNRRIGDIVEPDVKMTSVFDNKLEMNTFYDLSVIYDLKCMQILVNGKEQFFTKKQKYMKLLKFDELNLKEFELKIAGSKQTCLSITSLTVTEYDSDELIHLRLKQNIDNKTEICLSIDKRVKSDFEECISKLSIQLQKEIKNINYYLLTHKKLKISRKIEGTSQACKISYVSDHGFSYSIHVSESIMDHFFWWYMVSNYTYENKYMGRKNDLTTETLNKVAEISQEKANQLFEYYDECVGCRKVCPVVRTFYEHSGKKKAVCHGKMIMNMKVSTFHNLQFMFRVLHELLS